jgi:hypothetical protein
MLEHHADAGAQFRRVGFGIVDLDAAEDDFPALERWQVGFYRDVEIGATLA